jgi:hypothetical protein
MMEHAMVVVMAMAVIHAESMMAMMAIMTMMTMMMVVIRELIGTISGGRSKSTTSK